MRYPTILVVLLLGLMLFPVGSVAQNVDLDSMTKEEREAYEAQIRKASEQRRRQMMDRVGVTLPDTLPPEEEDPNRPKDTFQRRAGSDSWYNKDGNRHVRSKWGNWSNYIESKAGDYELNDPLKLDDGTPVESADVWWNRRRPEILHHYQTEIYGRIPEDTPVVEFEVVKVDSSALDGRAVRKLIRGHIDNSAYPRANPKIEFVLYLPVNVEGPVPVIVRAMRSLEGVHGPGSYDGPTPVEQVIGRGWAIATFNTYTLQADNGAGLAEGIIGLMNRGELRKPDQWGVLAAWSWGLSRVLDYLETEASVDATKAGLQGHSRWGKTALLTSALDSRWAVVYASCSGAMGASLEKRNWGETIDNVAWRFYYWMAGNFLKYADNRQHMPVDAHMLIALSAPRPVFITGGTRDQWADPHGMYLAVRAASPVYELLDARGVTTEAMPEPDVALTEGELAFRNHRGGHHTTPDWPFFLDFAQRYLE